MHRHYEILLNINSEHNDLIFSIVEKCTQSVEDNKGKMHRIEKEIEYSFATHPSAKKSRYILMNIECDSRTRDALEEYFRLNDAIKYYLILKKETAVTELSVLSKPKTMARSSMRTKQTPITSETKNQHTAQKIES